MPITAIIVKKSGHDRSGYRSNTTTYASGAAFLRRRSKGSLSTGSLSALPVQLCIRGASRPTPAPRWLELYAPTVSTLTLETASRLRTLLNRSVAGDFSLSPDRLVSTDARLIAAGCVSCDGSLEAIVSRSAFTAVNNEKCTMFRPL